MSREIWSFFSAHPTQAIIQAGSPRVRLIPGEQELQRWPWHAGASSPLLPRCEQDLGGAHCFARGLSGVGGPSAHSAQVPRAKPFPLARKEEETEDIWDAQAREKIRKPFVAAFKIVDCEGAGSPQQAGCPARPQKIA